MEQINLNTNTSAEFLEKVGEKMMEIYKKGEVDIWKLAKGIKKDFEEEQNLDRAMSRVQEPDNEEDEELMDF